MEETTILDVLKQWNPWEKVIDSGIPRPAYIDKIYPYLERKEVLVLKGIRRAGKSTLAKQLIQRLIKNQIDKKQILYLNLEDYNFANNLEISLFDEVFNTYKKHVNQKKKTYFFIDEVQKIKGWEKWVRTQYDRGENIKFIVTGSSASLLSKELSTLLTGRNLSFHIMPLSFKEFKRFHTKSSLEEYLAFGGFPEVVLEESEEKKRQLLQQYLTDIIHKDIIDRYNIRNTKQLIEIARYLVSTAGAKVSSNKLSRVFGISKDTISTYLSYMVDAYLLQKVTYFSYSAKVKHDVAKLPKLYVTDNGLIQVATVKYSKNRGQMFENSVLIKLLEKFDEISYWADGKSEVDFIAGNQAINVTSTDKIPPREMKGLHEFKKNNKTFSELLIAPTKKNKNMAALEDFLNTPL